MLFPQARINDSVLKLSEAVKFVHFYSSAEIRFYQDKFRSLAEIFEVI